MQENIQASSLQEEAEEGTSILELAIPLAEHRWLLALTPIAVGAVVLGITFLIPPTFTARTSFLPPQQQQSAAASMLASLGNLSGLAGAANVKSPADQYVALMQSETVADRIIDRFGLMQLYDAKYRLQARKELSKNVRISAGKKDGLITVEVDDEDPKRAADMANRHVEELRSLTSQLALSEAQQRRVFFEAQLTQTRDHLTRAQQALQESGFTPGALKAEPKSAAEEYAKLRAEATATEVRLQAFRKSLADTAPEILQQQARLDALRSELAKAEASTTVSNGPDYISKYREFKYQEALFDMFARQYELARLDESREGALIQVIDPAKPPELKSRPKRALTALGSAAACLLLLSSFLLLRQRWRDSLSRPETAKKLARLRTALGRS